MNDIQRQVWAEQNAMANEGRFSEYDATERAEMAAQEAAFVAAMEADDGHELAMRALEDQRDCGRRKGHEGPCNGRPRQSCPATA